MNKGDCDFKDTTFYMKAGKKPFVSFSILFALNWLVIIIAKISQGYVFFSTPQATLSFFKVVIIYLMLPLTLFTWFLGFRIMIEDGVLIYKTLFSHKELPLKEIVKYRIQHGYGGWNNLRKPYFRLEIFGKPKKEPEIMINLHIFSRSDCKQLFDILKNVVEENKKNGKE